MPALFYSPYSLVSLSPLNAKRESQTHHGALLAIQYQGHWGYSALHPWPEFGDEILNKQLASLKTTTPLPLAQRALQCAHIDYQARREKKSLFAGLPPIKNHATLPFWTRKELDLAIQRGFSTVKIKIPSLDEATCLRLACSIEQLTRLRWRLDFNGLWPLEACRSFLEKIASIGKKNLLNAIDFVEDPCLDGASIPESFMVPIALDFLKNSVKGLPSYWVVKPSREDPLPFLKLAKKHQKKIVFTSSMEHPLGVSFSAWYAAITQKKHPSCVTQGGLITHHLFAPDHFSQALGTPQPTFSSPKTYGLGFDPLLSSLPWKPLN